MFYANACFFFQHDNTYSTYCIEVTTVQKQMQGLACRYQTHRDWANGELYPTLEQTTNERPTTIVIEIAMHYTTERQTKSQTNKEHI